MAADPLAGVGAVSGVGGPALPTLPQAVRTAPFQAVVLAAPVMEPGAALTGRVGAMLPDGTLPLTTANGQALLRPVPGAWPADLPPGTEVSLTPGANGRANAVVLRLPDLDRPLAAPPARTTGGAEAALRGMLATPPVLAREAAALQQAPAAAVATSVAPPAQAQAPLATPALTAAAGTVQPKPAGPLPLAGLVAEGPRLSAAVQTPQAVAGAGGSAGAAAQDLLQQAAQRARAAVGTGPAGLGPAAGGMGVAEELAAPSPAVLAEVGPRPDLALAAALGQPGMLARLAAYLPRPDRLGGPALLLYLFGARNGGARAWLGDGALAHLTKADSGALATLEEAMVPTQRLAADGTAWTTLLLPYRDGEELSALLLAHRHLWLEPEEGGGAEGTGLLPGTAFVLGAMLAELGAVQLKGLAAPHRLRLELTVGGEPDAGLRDRFAAGLSKALDGVSLTIRWGTPPAWPELMPGA